MTGDRLFLKAVLAGALLSSISSCSSDSLNADSSGDGVTGGACVPNMQSPCSCIDGSSSYQACNAAGTGYDVCQCGGAMASAMGDLPCDVKNILEQNCWECHSSPPKWGAPMALTGSAAFRAVSSDPSMTVGQMALVRVNSDDDPMPELPRDRLTPAQIATLSSWVDAGSPAGSCQPVSPMPTGTSTGPMPTGTSTSEPPYPTGTSTMEPPPPPPPGETCYTMIAHAGPDISSKYDVPGTPDLYQCFFFDRPWGDKQVHLTRTRTIIDNTAVIHHWILYNNAGTVQHGTTSSCGGAHSDAAFIAGWAPGGGDMELPPEVGMQIGGLGFTLEIHYNNTQGQQVDGSGLEVCVTEELRPNVAAVHWLGTENINGTTATGVCDPNNTGPVNILSVSPHMHLKGRHMTTVINRAGGGVETLHDEPFDFNTQIGYETPAIINPGDTLTTTCQYASPSTFGEGTNDEMCYNFVLAYPAGQLSTGFLRPNGCTSFF